MSIALKQDILDLEKFRPYRISVLEQLISRAIARQYSDEHGLSRMQWRVLSTIAMSSDISARDICRFTRMEKMQVSRAIQGLRQQKFIAQAKNHQDQRSTVLNLTAKGKRIYSRIVPKVLDEEARIFSAFSASEQATFDRLIHKLSTALEFES